MSQPTTKTFLFAAVVIVAIGIAIGAFVKRQQPKELNPIQTQQEADSLEMESKQAPFPWLTTSDPLEATVKLTDGSPVLQFGKFSFSLMPNAKKLALSWHIQHSDNKTFCIGEGEWFSTPVLFVWSFAEGNPQIRFSFQFLNPPKNSAPFKLQWEFQDASSHTDVPLTHTPFLFQSSDKYLLLSNGEFERAHFAPVKEGDALHYLDLFWDTCSTSQKDDTPLQGSFTLTFSDKPIPTIRALPSFFSRPVIVPLFYIPSVDQAPRHTVPKTSEEVVQELRALLYGHSNPEDPRHGTSGLMTAELSSTVIIPPTFSVKSIAEQMHTTAHFELLPSEPWNQGKTSLDTDICLPKISFLLNNFDSDSTPYIDIPAGGLFGGSFQLSNIPTFQTYASDLFDQAPIDAGSVRLIGRALLVSRNPLIEQTRQSLLSPDRYGEWQVSDAFALLVARVSEGRMGGKGVRYTTLKHAVEESRSAMQVETWYGSDGYQVIDKRGVSKEDEAKLVLFGDNLDGLQGLERDLIGGGYFFASKPKKKGEYEVKYLGKEWPTAIHWNIQ